MGIQEPYKKTRDLPPMTPGAGVKLRGLDTSSNEGTLDWQDVIDVAGGASDFTDLGDVPSEYVAGDALKIVRVNASFDGLEFATGTGGGLDNVIEDTSPELGGNLVSGGFTIDNRDVDADGTKLDLATLTGAVDLDQMDIDVAANNSKVTNVTTDLTDSADATTVTIISSDGTDAVLEAATGSVAGIFTAANWTKLDGIAAGANVGLVNVVEDATPQLGADLDTNGNAVSFDGYEILPRATATINDNEATEVAITTYTGADFDGVWINYVVTRTGDGQDIGTMQILNDGTSITFSEVQTTLGTSGVTLSASINAGTVTFEYTSTSTGNAGTIAYTIGRMNG